MIKEMNAFFESSYDDKFREVETIGSFANANKINDFDTIFQEACDRMETIHHMGFSGGFLSTDVLKDPTNAVVMDFKEDLIRPFEESVAKIKARMENEYRSDSHMNNEGVGNLDALTDRLGQLYDNKINTYMEAASVGQMLPLKTIDMPIMIKNHVQLSFKDVVNEEISPSLIVKKQIEQKYAYAKRDKSKVWMYPQCLFDDSFKDIISAASGVQLATTQVPLNICNYNIVEELTDVAVPEDARVVLDITIDQVVTADNTVVTLSVPMHVNLADGMWVGGVINQKYTNTDGEEAVLDDIITGYMDWTTHKTTLTSATQKVKAVIFNGKLSNEGNENTVRFMYKRKDYEWHIGEGAKADAAYTLEELQEHKALLDVDLYTRSYNDLLQLLRDLEDNDGYAFLDREFNKYKGVKMDPLGWNPLVMTTEFDCDSRTATTALPSEYLTKELKFKIDRFITDIADTVKMENLKFVVYGNPRYIALLEPSVKWIFKTGDRVGGVKLDYSYGIMTSGETSIFVVSSKKLSANKYRGLRFIPFGDKNETITFKRYKFSTDIVTSKDTAYKDTERVGGSQTYVFATSRYKDISLQGIQAELTFKNADFITIY